LAQKPFEQHFPRPGWVEHDAEQIWETQIATARSALRKTKLKASSIAALGITQQRETVVAWDSRTGRPLGKALVWQDRRTSERCHALRADGHEPELRRKTGLLLDPYFSATKMEWLLKNRPEVKKAAVTGRLRLGTIDSWLLYRLTQGEVFATEPSNAARTLLFNLPKGEWDGDLLELFGIPREALGEVRDSSSLFGVCKVKGLEGIPITGILGDQQASLFGHRCLREGEGKNTYGTGCFLLRNAGESFTEPPQGLLGTVAWRISGKTTYALEGAVLAAGAAIQFLRDGMGLIRKSSESESLAKSLKGNDGVYCVPAFAGLGTPYWDPDARGLFIGLTRGTTPAHFARAALESIAYQTRDLVEAFPRSEAKALSADGGATANGFLIQFQADILNQEVFVPAHAEVTAAGAAMMAALGGGLIQDAEELRQLRFPGKRYRPKMKAEEREALYARWREAVARSLHWDVKPRRA
jgi:glycerol kinase